MLNLKINKIMATKHGATLNGTVNPNGLDTTVKFLYGTDPELVGALEVDLPEDIPAGKIAIPVSVPVTDLDAETTYYFKVSAENAEGKAEGTILDFLTPVSTDIPTVETLPATDLV
jgi:hypothetical protein